MSESMPDKTTLPSSTRAEIHESFKRHKKEAWWQVTFPVLVITLLSITAVILTYVLGKEQGAPSIVADYALILLIILGLLGGLIVLAPVVALIFGISALIKKTPPYTSKAQSFMRDVYEWVDDMTDRIANIIILARSALAGVNAYLQAQGIILPRDNAPQDTDKQATSE